MFYLTLLYILILHLIVIVYRRNDLIVLYYFCFKTSRLQLKEFTYYVLTFHKYYYYSTTVLEEALFRLPLLYFTSDFSYWFFITIFALQHYDMEVNLRKNIEQLIHCFFFGFLMTECFLNYGFLVSVSLHLLNNFISNFENFPYEWRRHNARLMFNYLDALKNKTESK